MCDSLANDHTGALSSRQEEIWDYAVKECAAVIRALAPDGRDNEKELKP